MTKPLKPTDARDYYKGKNQPNQLTTWCVLKGKTNLTDCRFVRFLPTEDAFVNKHIFVPY